MAILIGESGGGGGGLTEQQLQTNLAATEADVIAAIPPVQTIIDTQTGTITGAVSNAKTDVQNSIGSSQVAVLSALSAKASTTDTTNVTSNVTTVVNTARDNVKTEVDVQSAVVQALLPTHTAGAGAPGTTPTKIGNIYYDVTNKIEYFADGTASSANWKKKTLYNNLSLSGVGSMVASGASYSASAATATSSYGLGSAGWVTIDAGISIVGTTTTLKYLIRGVGATQTTNAGGGPLVSAPPTPSGNGTLATLTSGAIVCVSASAQYSASAATATSSYGLGSAGWVTIDAGISIVGTTTTLKYLIRGVGATQTTNAGGGPLVSAPPTPSGSGTF